MSLHIDLSSVLKGFGHEVQHALNRLETDAQAVYHKHGHELVAGLEAGAKAAIDSAPGVISGVLQTISGDPHGISKAIQAALGGIKEVKQDLSDRSD